MLLKGIIQKINQNENKNFISGFFISFEEIS